MPCGDLHFPPKTGLFKIYIFVWIHETFLAGKSTSGTMNTLYSVGQHIPASNLTEGEEGLHIQQTIRTLAILKGSLPSINAEEHN